MGKQEGFPLPQDEELEIVASGNWELARPAGLSSTEEADMIIAEPEAPLDKPDASPILE